MDKQLVIPSTMVEKKEFEAVMKRLDLIDERMEFFNSELSQRMGRKVGKDIGILYGAVVGILMFLIYLIISA
ncbi:MAG: tetrahydromethanopterin S-methyltransferase subunit G [Methanosarcinaceae archaeon]|jgi:tetrahydromethanopterin S-methyltransferase subunit G|nr:tetrahydromethanopterin S-methyltransferase subunit G [Methanosarcinaceae archaeon]NKQ38679.1 tetrahydromethanopterin S-methyltransferase subunit G [Methanosarcinales archaeon]